jgi:hypothetical protein
MIEFVQATKDDVLNVCPQTMQGQAMTLAYGREAFEKDLIPLEGMAVAVHDSDKCIGVYGVVQLWPGVARVWSLFSEDVILEHPTLLGLHIRRDLRKAEQLGFHRIEATTNVEHLIAIEFIQWLGFESEGLMRKYTPTGDDMYLFAKVSNGV